MLVAIAAAIAAAVAASGASSCAGAHRGGVGWGGRFLRDSHLQESLS